MFTYNLFADTEYVDAARVVYFANYYKFMHQCYETWLRKSDVPMVSLFNDHNIIIPVIESKCNYFRPIHMEQAITVQMTCKSFTENTYILDYTLVPTNNIKKKFASGYIKYMCIQADKPSRCNLPKKLASALQGILVS